MTEENIVSDAEVPIAKTTVVTHCSGSLYSDPKSGLSRWPPGSLLTFVSILDPRMREEEEGERGGEREEDKRNKKKRPAVLYENQRTTFVP